MALDFKLFKSFCEERGILVDERATAVFKDGVNSVVDFGIPLVGRLISPFVTFLTKAIPEGQRLYDFRGAFLLIGEIGIWDPDLENSAKLLFESIRGGTPIEKARGQAYRPDEYISYHASVMLALLTGWDALVVLDECDYLVIISHDEYVRLVFREAKLAKEVEAMLQDPDAYMLQKPPWTVRTEGSSS